MIIGIGTDFVDHSEIQRLGWDSDDSVQSRIFSEEERRLYTEKPTIRFLAGRFAVKEAILKCLGTGMEDGIPLTDISIITNENGKPIAELVGEVKRASLLLGINKWHISISHANNTSYAFVIAEKIST